MLSYETLPQMRVLRWSSDIQANLCERPTQHRSPAQNL